MRRFRKLNQAWALLFGYFWTTCPICGQMFGGHECGTRSVEATKSYLPGLREFGDDVQVTAFPSRTRKIACWRHG